MLTIDLLYKYVHANYSQRIPNLSLAAKKIEQLQIARKKKTILEVFSFLEPGHARYEAFFTLLVALDTENSLALVDILYPLAAQENYYTNLEQFNSIYTHYLPPSDDKIISVFNSLNTAHKCIAEPRKPDEENRFIILFKACKLMIDFVGQSNPTHNLLAYEYAYKMLVFFQVKSYDVVSIFKPIKAYFNQFENSSHTFLEFKLPENNSYIQYLDQWRNLFSINPNKVLKIFKMAPQIEALLKRAPLNIREAEESACNVRFKNADGHMDLALVCIEYNLPETYFNECLELVKRRKEKDNLPNLIISSDKHPDYYLVKLPINDPRIYVLGYITHCCLTLEKEGSECISDGNALANNGFYVLLKGKGNPFHANGEINYQKFSIVGQGYAWISTKKFLTFDSWDNLRNTDDEVAFDLISIFAEKICLDDIYNGVTIGTGARGGRTPVQFGQTTLYRAEIMREGSNYGDANTQVLVQVSPKVTQAISKAKCNYPAPIQNKLNDILPANEIQLIKNLSKTRYHPFFELLLSNPAVNSEYLVKLSDALNCLKYIKFTERKVTILTSLIEKILDEPSGIITHRVTQLFKDRITDEILLDYAVKYTQVNFEVLLFLNKNKSLTEEICELIEKCDYEEQMMTVELLSKANLLNHSNLKWIISSEITEKADLVKIWMILSKNKLLTEENKELLNSNLYFCSLTNFITLFTTLSENNLLNNDNLMLIVLFNDFSCIVDFNDFINLLNDLSMLSQENFENSFGIFNYCVRSSRDFKPIQDLYEYNELNNDTFNTLEIVKEAGEYISMLKKNISAYKIITKLIKFILNNNWPVNEPDSEIIVHQGIEVRVPSEVKAQWDIIVSYGENNYDALLTMIKESNTSYLLPFFNRPSSSPNYLPLFKSKSSHESDKVSSTLNPY